MGPPARHASVRSLVMAAAGEAAAGCSSSSKSSATTGATSGSNAAKAPYKVVQLASATGAASSTGLPGQNGAIAAIDAINAAGGVNGHRIDLINLDSQSTSTGAGAAINQAVGDHPLAIISNDSSTDEATEDGILGPAQIPWSRQRPTTPISRSPGTSPPVSRPSRSQRRSWAH